MNTLFKGAGDRRRKEVSVFHAFLIAMISVVILFLLGLAAPAQAAPPDLTKDQNVDRHNTYNLGPTGARGWIFQGDGDQPGPDLSGRHGTLTAQSRQILITTVGANTPASNVLQVNDVILGVGVGGGPVSNFSSDARKSLGWAIGEAETSAHNGILKLRRWRAGTTSDVQLQLQIMGTYSETAPFNCPKSTKILANACSTLAKEGMGSGFAAAVQGLALLACGDANSMAKARAHARARAPQNLQLGFKEGMVVWDWGYTNLFLAEYYLRTGDTNVLHGLNEYTIALAKGQSMFGTFGHGLTFPNKDGVLHGSVEPYGPVNSAGLPANVSLVLGRKAGVVHPELDPAIARAANFFSYYVGKGGVPYGEHEPWVEHASNGKNAMTAVLFGLLGNKPVQSEYFARTVVAEHEGREYGHTGQGFSYLWNAMGANVGGPNAAAAHLRQVRWHLDLSRRTDGSFVYDGREQAGGGSTADGTYLGKSGYYGLSPTATYILTYALPLKNLFITGKDSNEARWLNAAAISDAVEAGQFFVNKEAYNVTQLMAALNKWDPVVQSYAADELGKRILSTTQLNQLLSMAEGSNASVRAAASRALGALKYINAVPVLGRRLTDTDPWVRTQAAKALKNFGDGASSQLPLMLSAAANMGKTGVAIDWRDPIQFADGALADVLFRPKYKNMAGVNKEALLYPAIRGALRLADGRARNSLYDWFGNRLTLDDVKALGPEIIESIHTGAPANTMFRDASRLWGVQMLAKYYVAEGIPLATQMLVMEGWGKAGRRTSSLDSLTRYRGAAKSELPPLRSELASQGSPGDAEYAQRLSETIDMIANDRNPPRVVYITQPGSFIVTASAGANGSINPSSKVSVTKGGNKTFTIRANPNYVIESVIVNGVNKGALPAYTFHDVQAGQTISATFKANTSNDEDDNGGGGGLSGGWLVGLMVAAVALARTSRQTVEKGYSGRSRVR